jgi:hypothetical protein
VRFFVVLAMLAPLGACDLQPPVKKEPPAAPPTGSAAPSAPAAPTLPPAPPPDAAATPDAFDVTQPCLDVASHITQVLIKEAKDPSQRAALQQEQTKIIRRAAEGCTRDHWPEAAIACFLKADTVATMEVCGKDLKAP